MLAVVFGCQRFHQYIYGKKVTIQSDHKPLEAIMKKPLQNTPPRLQRMLLSLQKCNIDLVYLAGKENILADTLSHAHLEETTDDIPEEELPAQVHMVYENAPAMKSILQEIKEETAKCPGLKKFTKCIIEGWPNSKDNIPNDAKLYWSFREELSTINGIAFKGKRLVIPEVMRKKVLEQLHQAHMEIEKTKWRARAKNFWPQIHQQIKNMVKKCSNCQQNQRKQQCEPVKASDVPQYPFWMVGSDLLNCNGQDFALVLDYYSRCWDIEKLYKTDSATVIKKLKHIFSRMGIPEVMK